MDTLTGLAVIALAAFVVWGVLWLSDAYDEDDGPHTDFDQYVMPREDLILRDADDIPDMILEGLTFYGVCGREIGPLRDFAADKVGWYYGDIFRAFYRAKSGIEDN